MSNIHIYDNRYKKLAEIDWNFCDSEVDSLAGIHPYPARYISEIPGTLIDMLGCHKGACIVDPFCGSGTTLVEAQKRGIPSVGIDLNPIACLISEVKVNNLPDEFINVYPQVIKKAMESANRSIIPMIPNLDHWFKKDIQIAIASLLQQIEIQENQLIQNALKLALSSIIVRVSNQESDTRYAAVDNNYTLEDVYMNFTNACKKLYAAKAKMSSTENCHIINQDILTVTNSQIPSPIGLVITSPPYPNAYEYWLYHKYRMWWLGFDPISVRTYEIGARPHYQKNNGQNADDFAKQMSKVFDILSENLIKNGHICFVVGRSIIKGKIIDNSMLITDIAKKHGLTLVVDIEREIAPTRKSFNLKYGKIKVENILVYRKGK